jgi:hypothetical protein
VGDSAAKGGGDARAAEAPERGGAVWGGGGARRLGVLGFGLGVRGFGSGFLSVVHGKSFTKIAWWQKGRLFIQGCLVSKGAPKKGGDIWSGEGRGLGVLTSESVLEVDFGLGKGQIVLQRLLGETKESFDLVRDSNVIRLTSWGHGTVTSHRDRLDRAFLKRMRVSGF